jgi:opacity protein-like surface antigen
MKTRLVVSLGFAGSLLASTALAQEGQVEKNAADAQLKRLSLGAQIELVPYGQISAGNDDVDFKEDTAFIYGVGANLDFYLNQYLSIGFAPRFLLNVTTKDQADEQEDDDALKQLDLRARVKGEFPVSRVAHLYGYVAPGYSLIFANDNDFGPVNIDDAKGFVLAFAAGATFDLSANLFLNTEVGYQLGFQQSSASLDGIDGDADFDFKTNNLAVGVGLGTRF